MRRSLFGAGVAALLAAAALPMMAASQSMPEISTRPRRQSNPDGWPKFRRDRALHKEIEAHNKAVEQKKRDRQERRQAKRMAGSQA